jgi:hypothetical protein
VSGYVTVRLTLKQAEAAARALAICATDNPERALFERAQLQLDLAISAAERRQRSRPGSVPE